MSPRPNDRKPFLKALEERVEASLTAAAFAEEREFDVARGILAEARIGSGKHGDR